MKLIRILVALSMAIGVVAAPATTLAASQPTLVATVPLTLDCSSVPATPQATAMLKKFGLCGFASKSAITPNNIVYGSCGSLSLYVYNAGQGWLQWKAEITSSLGPFVTANYTGTWANTTQWTSGVVNRTNSGITSDWLDIYPILTGPGFVIGRINFAKDLLFWGGICTNTSVVDSSAQVWSF